MRQVPLKPPFKIPRKVTYDSPAAELNEIDDGYGSPAAPIISAKPEMTYQPPMKMHYKMRPPMYRMKKMYKMKKPLYMMFPKMPRYKLKMPKFRFPKFMIRMPKMPKFPRMKLPKFKPMFSMYRKPAMKPVIEEDHSGYKHMQNLDYSGWTPIGMMKEPEQPSYNEVDESPIVTIEDAYNSPAAKPIPPLPSGEGYDAPEVITAAPADSYGAPEADPIATYEEPVADSYGEPAAEPIKAAAPAPSYEEPAPAVKEPEPDTYGEPQAPLVTYKQPAPAEYGAPAPAPTPLYNTPAPVSYYSQPTLAPLTTYAQPAYAQPAYGGYNSPIEEPLFQYAPVSDLNNLAAIAAEDTYSASPAAPPSPGSYQATGDANALAEDVQSGSVYVQPQHIVSLPSYGEKVPNQYGAPGPSYYQSPSYSQTQYTYPTYQGTGGKSSASFKIHVNGKEHGHSYSHDHKV